jgi:hypothetical protein
MVVVGALVAAIYDKYANQKMVLENLTVKNYCS